MINLPIDTRPAIIDFETLDTKSTAQCISLAITYFNPAIQNSFDELEKQSIQWNFIMKDQKDRSISVDTIEFWISRGKEVFDLNRAKPLLDVNEVLLQLNAFIRDKGITHLMGNGSDFDNSILNSLYSDYNITPALPFWTSLDMRTLKWLTSRSSNSLVPIWLNNAIPHYAKHDCIMETMHTQNIIKYINNAQGDK